MPVRRPLSTAHLEDSEVLPVAGADVEGAAGLAGRDPDRLVGVASEDDTDREQRVEVHPVEQRDLSAQRSDFEDADGQPALQVVAAAVCEDGLPSPRFRPEAAVPDHPVTELRPSLPFRLRPTGTDRQRDRHQGEEQSGEDDGDGRGQLAGLAGAARAMIPGGHLCAALPDDDVRLFAVQRENEPGEWSAHSGNQREE